jgi:hypothetical protein
MARYFCWILDNVISSMKPSVGQYLMVYDLEDTGYENFSLSHAKRVFPVLQKVFCDTCKSIIILN